MENQFTLGSITEINYLHSSCFNLIRHSSCIHILLIIPPVSPPYSSFLLYHHLSHHSSCIPTLLNFPPVSNLTQLFSFNLTQLSSRIQRYFSFPAVSHLTSRPESNPTCNSYPKFLIIINVSHFTKHSFSSSIPPYSSTTLSSTI